MTTVLDSGSPEAISRLLLRSVDRAVLATQMADGCGPYASLVMMAVDITGQPILLISTLADHTQNLLKEARASLLLDGTTGLAEPLTGPRLSVQGRIMKSTEPEDRARYLRRHPSAAMYAGFGDFSIYKMAVERVHLVAGFGKIHWLPAHQVLDQPAHALLESEADVVEHMNADHADAVDLYARVLLGAEAEGWTLTGVDPEGADLRRQGDILRLPFQKTVTTAEETRVELVRLVKKARQQQAT